VRLRNARACSRFVNSENWDRSHSVTPLKTSAGRLPYKAIIHVAGINMLWRSSERSIRDSTRNAIQLAVSRGYKSIALPLVGAGSGGGKADRVQSMIEDEQQGMTGDISVIVVRYRKKSKSLSPADQKL